MELILWRHAEAEDSGSDLERRLTPNGETQAERMAAFLRTRLPRHTRILVSPALRARQTARALTDGFEVEPRVGPGSDPKAALAAAAWPDGEGSVMIVGHQPYLGQIAGQLLANGAVACSIGKGAVWWLARRDDETVLRLCLGPDLV